MKIITYSDLHLEFGTDFLPPEDNAANLMILAGDIITFKDYRPLARFLNGWKKPVLYVTGNHEYYTRQPMDEENAKFKIWLTANHPNVTLLQDEAISIGGIHFFGGTMWTDFRQADKGAMSAAMQQMNDYRYIMTPEREDAITFYESIGALPMSEWTVQRVNGNALEKLAAGGQPAIKIA